ncbi:MAG: hypothetical protein VX278_12305 [Myxococcota bacterium]|nr:hypothetical protein [Myxococcota bacterium]
MDLDEAQKKSWIFGGAVHLSLADGQLGWLDENGLHLQHAMWAYRELLGRAHYHVPFGFVLDVYLLLRSGTQFLLVGHDDVRSELRKSLLGFQSEFLCKIARHPLFEDIHEHLIDSEKIQWLCVVILEKCAPLVPHTVEIYPRDLDAYAHANIRLSQLQSSWKQRTDLYEAYRTILNERETSEEDWIQLFVSRVQEEFDWVGLFDQEMILILSKWRALHRRDLQYGFRQLMECKAAIGRLDVQRLSPVNESKEVESLYTDENLYPTGGLSGLTNRGSIENLLRSELSYMEDESRFDLFSLRYLEGELLYYLRDDGILLRKRRHIVFCFDLGVSFGFKPPKRLYRMGTCAQGLALVFYEALLDVFINDAVRISFVYVGEEKELLQEDIELLSVLLEERQQRDEVQVTYQRTLDLSRLIAEKHKPYVVYFHDDAERQNDTNIPSVFLSIDMMDDNVQSILKMKVAAQRWIRQLLNSRLER